MLVLTKPSVSLTLCAAASVALGSSGLQSSGFIGAFAHMTPPQSFREYIASMHRIETPGAPVRIG